ncbi:MAG: hypothetical protein AAF551_12850, partial [Bacteroidota bacterium]
MTSCGFLMCLILLNNHAAAQQSNAGALYREGIKALNVGNSKTAIQKFQAAVTANKTYADAWYYLGKTYAREQMHKEAIFSFRSLEKIKPNYNATLYYDIGSSYIALNELTNAGFYLKKYVAKIPGNAKSERARHIAKNRLIYASESPIVRDAENTTDAPVPVKAINSISGDYMPQVNPTGTKMYFTSVRQGGFDFRNEKSKPNDYGEDLYYSTLQNGSWTAPKLLPEPLNSLGNDFGSAFTGDGQTMVYVKCDTKDGVGSCDLFITQLEGSTWMKPKNLGNVVNSDKWE